MTTALDAANDFLMGSGPLSPELRDLADMLRSGDFDEEVTHCPAHEDHNPSLAITATDDRTLVHCRAGCSTADVLTALGLTYADLYAPEPEGPSSGPHGVPEGLPVPYPKQCTYTWVNENKTPLFTTHRTPGKSFPVMSANGTSGLNGTRRVLYRLPEVLAAVKAGGEIHVAEGEKDADALAIAGVTATTNLGGAANWKDADADTLKGASLVVVWQDRDEAGRKRCVHVGETLAARGIPYRVVMSRVEDEKADAYDHLAAGWSVADAVPVEPPAQSRLEVMRSKLLTPAQLKGLTPPDYLIKGWLKERASARLNGQPGSGKSLHLLDMAASIGAGVPWHDKETKQGTVVYLIAEGIDGFMKRVPAWEQHYGRPMENVIFYPEPVQILGRTGGELGQSPEWVVFRQLVHEIKPSLVIVDTQRRTTLAADENSNSDLQKAVDALDRMKRETGCAWLMGHHTTKDGNGGGSGGGSMWGAADTELLATTKGLGLTARFGLENTKEKDNESGRSMDFQLRQYNVSEALGMDPFNDPETSVVLVLADSVERTDDPLPDLPEDPNPSRQAILEIVRRVYGAGTFSKAEIKSQAVPVSMTKSSFYRAWTELVRDGRITPEVLANGSDSKTSFEISPPIPNPLQVQGPGEGGNLGIPRDSQPLGHL
jgi:hypothetical protein